MKFLKRLPTQWVLLFVLALGFAQTSHAKDVVPLDTVINTDYASAGVGGLRSNGVGRIVLSGLSGQVTRAYLYWHGPTQTTNPNANSRVRVNQEEIIGTHIGFSDDNCWNFLNSQAYRADVTALVHRYRNANYDLSSFTKPGGIEVNGASLLVFYDDGIFENNRDVIVFDGNDSNIPNVYDSGKWDVFLSGIRYTTGRAFLELHVSDGQRWRDSAIYMNNQVFLPGGALFEGDSVPASNTGPVELGALWDIKRADLTSVLVPGSNDLRMNYNYERNDDCVSLVVAVIDLPTGAAPPNNPPVLQCSPPASLERPGQVDLIVQVADPDGDPLTVEMIVDGQSIRVQEIPASSGPISVSLTFSHVFGMGDHVVTFRLTDSMTEVQCITSVAVRDNHTPTLICLGPVQLGVPGPVTLQIDVEDSDGDPLTVEFHVNGTLISSATVPGGGLQPTVATRSFTHDFGLGQHAVVVRVNDGQAAAECAFPLTVRDTTPPTIECPPNSETTAQTENCAAQVGFVVSARDDFSVPRVVCVPPSDSFFPIGTTRVECVAQDAAGLTATCSFEVTVTADGEGGLVLRKTATRLAAGLGEEVTYVYEVVNTGCTPLSELVITDDNGTPGLATDDFVVASGVTLGPKQARIFTRAVRLPITVSDPATGLETGTLVTEILPDGNVKVLFLQSLDVNDNTYGVNAMGWPKDHKFSNLTGSDRADFLLMDSTGREVLSFRLDYLTSSSAFPSGYGSLGVSGGDGRVLEGQAAHILSHSTSLADNLNKEPFLSQLSRYTKDSPALSDPNSAFWEYRMIYVAVISKAAFGSAGFGHVAIVDQHNSPAKIKGFFPTPINTQVTNIAIATAFAGAERVHASASAVVQIQANVTTSSDRDRDGMADSWEITHFGNLDRNGLTDFDQDGQTDLEEFLAGTLPTNPADLLKILTVIGGTGITWTAVPGKTYRVEFKDGMVAHGWQDLPGIIQATGTTATLWDGTSPQPRHRFYRVVLIP